MSGVCRPIRDPVATSRRGVRQLRCETRNAGAGIDFCCDHVITYQAIGIVPILLVLLSNARLVWGVIAGLGLWQQPLS